MSIIKSNKCYLTNNALIWVSNTLSNWLGLEISIKNYDNYSYQINLIKFNKIIIIDNLVENFANPSAILDFTFWDPKSEGYHSILNDPLPSPGYKFIKSPIIFNSDDKLYFHYDLIGLIYWSLVRVEEYNETILDKHDRFQNIFSHAKKFNYLDRPIVDEWVHILKQIINLKVPNIIFKTNNYKIILSHDVDRPFFYYSLPIIRLIRISLGDLIKRKNLFSAIKRLYYWVKINYFKNHFKDPFNTFDFIMNEAEKREINSFFYFMTSGKNSKYDSEYLINDKLIIELIKKIINRGHFIGIHPSYDTYLNPELIKKEINILLQTLRHNGISLLNLECRMHYLRYDISKTPIFLSLNGINRDSSLNYSNESGFRCGTCFDYEMFDHRTQQSLNLIQRPLLVMDNNFLPIDNTYVFQEKVNKVIRIKERCKILNGNFTILWHNSELYNSQLKDLFLTIIS